MSKTAASSVATTLRVDALAIVRTGYPHEVREFELGRLELYRIGATDVGRAIYEPGWRWSEHVRPLVGTELCEVNHVGLVLSGSAAVRMADGQECVIAAGDFFAIPPGHDSWVIGDERYVSLHLQGAETYAAAARDDGTGPDLERASELMRLIGLRFDELSATHVRGHFEPGSAHHQPWGIVHGGVFATAVETAATTGGYLATRQDGLTPVGVTNTTHFLRSHQHGRIHVEARALHQGRSGQLWTVELTRPSDQRRVAVGDVRLQNLEVPTTTK